MLIFLRVAYVFVCIGAILAYLNPETDGEPLKNYPALIEQHKFTAFFVLLVLSQVITVADICIRRKRIEVISAIYFGVLIGVLLAYLLIQALTPIVNIEYQSLANMIALLILPYVCVSLLLQTKDDFRFVIPYVEFSRDLKGGRPLVVDSSSLIDGRIADVVETQILETQLIVPDFVLAEIQDIADSKDKTRRTRGRRGLEVLTNMQQSAHTDISVQETSRSDFRASLVDHKLVELAKQLRGGVITNDYNLNKVASVQGIPVINLNDVANALRPQFIPGEQMRIRIMKEGESSGQGVGYLDDGTMVVCEGTSHLIGRDVDMVVSSVLQSSAGRMIFAKPMAAKEK